METPTLQRKLINCYIGVRILASYMDLYGLICDDFEIDTEKHIVYPNAGCEIEDILFEPEIVQLMDILNDRCHDIEKFFYTERISHHIIDRFKSNSIYIDDCDILSGKIAVNLDYDTLSISYITLDKYLNFDPAKQVDLEYLYTCPQRLSVKIGKFLNDLFSHTEYELTDNMREETVNSIKASILNDYRTVEYTTENIERIYSHESIPPNVSEEYTFIKSCMCSIDKRFLEFNKQFAHGILVLEDNNGYTLGRAMMWKCYDDAENEYILVDKIYLVHEYHTNVLDAYIAEKGYLKYKSDKRLHIKIDITFFENNKVIGVLDTFCWYEINSDRIYNTKPKYHAFSVCFNALIFRIGYYIFGKFKQEEDYEYIYENYIANQAISNVKRLNNSFSEKHYEELEYLQTRFDRFAKENTYHY